MNLNTNILALVGKVYKAPSQGRGKGRTKREREREPKSELEVQKPKGGSTKGAKEQIKF
jgi:hypothetical protein